MESRRSNKWKNKVTINDDLDDILSKEEQDLIVAEEKEPLYTNKVKLQLRISAKFIVTSDRTVSGKRYVWERAGAIVEVDAVDAPGLLAKQFGEKTCCGSSPDNLKIFIQIE